MDGDTFLGFVQRDLLPILLPFNGINHNSVVILDNCSVHHVSGVESMITEVEALVHYLHHILLIGIQFRKPFTKSRQA